MIEIQGGGSQQIDFPPMSKFKGNDSVEKIIKELIEIYEPVLEQTRLPFSGPHDWETIKKWFVCEMIESIRRFEESSYRRIKLYQIMKEIYDSCPIILNEKLMKSMRNSFEGYIRREHYNPYFIKKIDGSTDYQINQEILSFGKRIIEMRTEDLDVDGKEEDSYDDFIKKYFMRH